MIQESVQHGLASLARFSGRDEPRRFWPYALTVLGGTVVTWMGVFTYQMVRTVAAMEAYAAEHPEQVKVTEEGGRRTLQLNEPVPDLGPDVDLLLLVLAGLMTGCVLLLAAAVTRRLHDSGVSGWFGAPTAVLLATGLVMMKGLFGTAGDEGLGLLFLLAFGNNGLYLLSLAGLLYLLMRRSEADTNRFGPPPPDTAPVSRPRPAGT